MGVDDSYALVRDTALRCAVAVRRNDEEEAR